jgi:hypothetical protein
VHPEGDVEAFFALAAAACQAFTFAPERLVVVRRAVPGSRSQGGLAVGDQVSWKGADGDLPPGTVGRVVAAHADGDVEALFAVASGDMKAFTFAAHRLHLLARPAAAAAAALACEGSGPGPRTAGSAEDAKRMVFDAVGEAPLKLLFRSLFHFDLSSSFFKIKKSARLWLSPSSHLDASLFSPRWSVSTRPR